MLAATMHRLFRAVAIRTTGLMALRLQEPDLGCLVYGVVILPREVFEFDD